MALERRIKNHPSSRLKVFSRRWLELDIMKDWLVPHSNPVKAMCRACNKVINAGKSELMKHASGKKHAQKLLKLKTGKSQTQQALDFITNSLRIETDPCIEIVEERQSNDTLGDGEPQSCTTTSNKDNEILKSKGYEFAAPKFVAGPRNTKDSVFKRRNPDPEVLGRVTENNKVDHLVVYQKKHIELLSKIASALDRIASSQEALVKLKSLN